MLYHQTNHRLPPQIIIFQTYNSAEVIKFMARVYSSFPPPPPSPPPPSTTSEQRKVFTLWMKSLVLNGRGCTVYDSTGGIVYRVDNYGSSCSDNVYLMDLRGKIVLNILKKVFICTWSSRLAHSFWYVFFSSILQSTYAYDFHVSNLFKYYQTLRSRNSYHIYAALSKTKKYLDIWRSNLTLVLI